MASKSGNSSDAAKARAFLEAISDSLSQPLFAISANADAVSRLAGRSPPDLAEIRAALAEMVTESRRVDRLLADAQRRLATLELAACSGS